MTILPVRMSDQMLVSRKGLGAIVAKNVERISHLVNLDVVTIQNQGRRETEVARLTQGPEQGKETNNNNTELQSNSVITSSL